MIYIVLCMLLIIVTGYVYCRYMDTSQLFFTTNDYPELKILEDNWKIIASEIPPFDINKLDEYPKRTRSAWNNEEGKQLADSLKSVWVQGWQGDRIWYNFPLMYHNTIIDRADEICPQTIKLLKQISTIQIAGYSILMPKSKLPIHTDLTGKKHGSMACNFLLTDNNASLYVKDNDFKEHKHKQGNLVVFDSTNKHYADNKDDEIRVILYIDFKTNKFYN